MELAQVEEELVLLRDALDESRIRSLVAETPLAQADHDDAQRHHDVMAKERDRLREEISRLGRTRDELLDRLIEMR
jgi:hypothetical protein